MPHDFTSGHRPKRMESEDSNRYLYILVHNSVACNSQKVEGTQVSVHRWKNREAACSIHIQWNGSQPYKGRPLRGQTLHGSVYVSHLEWSNSKEKEGRTVVARAEGRGKWGSYCLAHTVLHFARWQISGEGRWDVCTRCECIHLKVAKVVNVMLCTSYHDFQTLLLHRHYRDSNIKNKPWCESRLRTIFILLVWCYWRENAGGDWMINLMMKSSKSYFG